MLGFVSCVRLLGVDRGDAFDGVTVRARWRQSLGVMPTCVPPVVRVPVRCTLCVWMRGVTCNGVGKPMQPAPWSPAFSGPAKVLSPFYVYVCTNKGSCFGKAPWERSRHVCVRPCVCCWQPVAGGPLPARVRGRVLPRLQADGVIHPQEPGHLRHGEREARDAHLGLGRHHWQLHGSCMDLSVARHACKQAVCKLVSFTPANPPRR